MDLFYYVLKATRKSTGTCIRYLMWVNAFNGNGELLNEDDIEYLYSYTLAFASCDPNWNGWNLEISEATDEDLLNNLESIADYESP